MVQKKARAERFGAEERLGARQARIMARRAQGWNPAPRMGLSMRLAVPIVLLCVLPPVQAERDEEAVALLQRAVAAQGELPGGGLQDVHITFQGHVNEPEQGKHSITRKYWYRSRDRSFRIQTYASIDAKSTRSERGVLGAPRPKYWEWSRESRMSLKPTNREHKKNIEAIDRDRADFERIVRMVVLSRADDELATIRFGEPRRAPCNGDAPNSPRYIFPDPDAEFLALDLQRAGSDPLRLFLHEDRMTVAKVVQFDRKEPSAVRFVYYLGAYRKQGGLNVPRYVSVHTAVPTEETREKTTRLAGRIDVQLNAGLGDEVFAAKPKREDG